MFLIIQRRQMRYSVEHKERSRARILQEASASLRMHGPEGVVVANIMAGAGLTHGGFYVHFQSKDDLIVGAIEESFAQTKAKFEGAVEGRPPTSALAAYIDTYLSIQHRDHRDRGCAIATLAGDASRLGPEAQRAYARGVEQVTRRIAGWLEASGYESPEDLAASVLATLVGAVVMARGVADPKASAKLLRTNRNLLRQRLGLT